MPLPCPPPTLPVVPQLLRPTTLLLLALALLGGTSFTSVVEVLVPPAPPPTPPPPPWGNLLGEPGPREGLRDGGLGGAEDAWLRAEGGGAAAQIGTAATGTFSDTNIRTVLLTIGKPGTKPMINLVKECPAAVQPTKSKTVSRLQLNLL